LERNISVEQDGATYAEEKKQEGQESEVMAPSRTTPTDGATAASSGSTSRGCDACTLSISQKDAFHHCSVCNGGDFDICSECCDLGARCLDSHHVITSQPEKRVEEDIEAQAVESKSQ
jgi:hypothetical protein